MTTANENGDPANSVQTERLRSVAIEACLAGGKRLRELFEVGETSAHHFDHDVKSSADRAAEDAMLEVIRRAYPAHSIYAEESGHVGGDGAFEWVVDPLDGTNNFESGLPTFSTAVTVRSPERVVLGVFYAPILDDLYVGVRGRGIQYNGRPVSTVRERATRSPSASTIVSVIGHDVKRDAAHSDTADALNHAIESRCKRRLESWSPTLHWGLLTRGLLDGIYCYRPDREEQQLGELFAHESGLHTDSGDEWFVAATTQDLNRTLVESVEEVLSG